MPTLLCHHTHTPCSNRTERQVRGHPSVNHHGDYLAFARALPAGVDVVFTRTEHWRADPTAFDDLESRVAAAGGAVRRFARHLVFSVEGTRAAVINGVEGSLEAEHNHLTVVGLPLADDRTFHDASVDRIAALADDVAWVAPAHSRFPGTRYPRERLARLVERAAGTGLRVALGYTTGYTPFLNRLARGTAAPGAVTGGSVLDWARAFDLPLVPELDWHVAVPRDLSGLGVVPDGAMDALAAGSIPVDDLLAARVLGRPGRIGLSMRAFLASYPDLLPLYRRGVYRRVLPSDAGSFERTRDASLAAVDGRAVDGPRFRPGGR